MLFRETSDTEREIVMASKQKQSEVEKWDGSEAWLHHLCLSFALETGEGCEISTFTTQFSFLSLCAAASEIYGILLKGANYWLKFLISLKSFGLWLVCGTKQTRSCLFLWTTYIPKAWGSSGRRIPALRGSTHQRRSGSWAGCL